MTPEDARSGKLILRLPKSIHADASRAAKTDGVSLNQWIASCVSLRIGTLAALSTPINRTYHAGRIGDETVSEPLVRRVRRDLYFVEWGNVRFGGNFSELTTFAEDLQNAMNKAIGGDAENEQDRQSGYGGSR